MFIETVKRPIRRPGPGRPRGRTPQGDGTRKRLYEKAITLISERGYEATTLRDVAQAADVSVGLIYRYFTDLDEFLAEFTATRVRTAVASVSSLPGPAGRGTGACVAARRETRAPCPAPRSQNPAAIRDREQNQASQNPGKRTLRNPLAVTGRYR